MINFQLTLKEDELKMLIMVLSDKKNFLTEEILKQVKEQTYWEKIYESRA